MAKDLDPSTKTLGTFFLFILIAYISYSLGRWSSQTSPNATTVSLSVACNQPVCKQAGATTHKEADPSRETTPKRAEQIAYDREVTRSAKWYELFADRALREAKQRDKEMRRDLEKWNEERRIEMKGFREDQLRWLLNNKQKEERGGWFGRGRRKKELKDT
jgi:hypothetical protein